MTVENVNASDDVVGDGDAKILYTKGLRAMEGAPHRQRLYFLQTSFFFIY